MKIYLIRHGESLANLGLVSADFSMDNQNTLSKKGENQIQAIIPAFQNCNIVRIFSSPMKRVVKSAEILQSGLANKPKIIIDDRLKEIDYGIFTDDRDNPEMQNIAKKQIAGDQEIRFGDGENIREILERFLDFLVDTYKKNQNGEIVVFSHGRLLSIVSKKIGEICQKKIKKSKIDNASIIEVELNNDEITLLKTHLNTLKSQF
jgi:probable phosphoglycerate mutase gpmB